MSLKYKVNSNTKLYLPSGSLTDQSGNGNNASNVGATLSKSGRFGDAYYFDGNDYLTIPDTNSLSFTNGVNDIPFTINIIANYISGTACFISKSTEFSTLEWAVKGIDGYPSLVLYSNNNASIYIVVSLNYKLTSGYNNITFTYNGGGVNGIKIYKNGIIQSVSLQTSGTYTRMINTNSTIDIGVVHRLIIGGSYYTGYIDSIIIENIEWTAKQVHNFFQFNFIPYYQ